MSQLAAQHLLAAIVGEEPDGGLIEIRPKQGYSKWFRVSDVERAARAAIKMSANRECWVGMAPRRPHIGARSGRQDGGSSAIERIWLVSADCDTDQALDALERFLPRPSFVLTSGSLTDSGEPKVHAHWALGRAITRSHVSHVKKRIAVALGSDPKIVDAARAMRLPGMLNQKHDPPTVCESIEDHPSRLYTPVEVLQNCPEIEPGRTVGARRETATNARADGEVLKQKQERISPREYVRDLAGIEVGADGKALCPFHTEDTPSLHAYAEPERGWYCYGCQVGGDIYTFAALLRGIPQRDLHGGEFERIWRQLRLHYGLVVDV